MGMKTVLGVVAFLAAVLIVIAWLFALPLKPVSVECNGNDMSCTESVSKSVDNCIPSVSTIRGEDMTILVNVSRGENGCVVHETVIDSAVPDAEGNLTGVENTCSIPWEELGGSDLISGCEGSFYDYVVESGGGSGGAPETEMIAGVPHMDCQRGDDSCKDRLYSNIVNCIPSSGTDVELKWEPSGFWTRYISITGSGLSCILYIEIINAVNIPPGEPSDIIGMNMTCNIPLSEIPLEDPVEDFCSGRLLDYLHGI